MIEKIRLLKEHHSKTDWGNTISNEEKSAIEEDLKDILAGKTVSNDEVKKKYGKWL